MLAPPEEGRLLECDTDGETGQQQLLRRSRLASHGVKSAVVISGLLLILGAALFNFSSHGTLKTASTEDGVSLLALPGGLQQLLGNMHLPPPPKLPWQHSPPAYPQYQPGYQQPGFQQVQQTYDCNVGYNTAGWVEGWTEAQMDYCCQAFQRGCRQPRLMSFYMYRAQSDEDFPMENVNLGDLPGVMRYLHEEIIVSTPRKYNVTRLMRFRVTMKTTPESYAQVGKQFGQFTAFDQGMCTVPNCAQIFQRDGYVVGCQTTNSAQGVGNYVALSSTGCTPPNCKEGTWYSLPGPCPSSHYNQRMPGCNLTEPGGQCQFVYGQGQDGKSGVTGLEIPPVSGTKDCAYYAKWAGQIYLNELIGLPTVEFGQKVHYERYTEWWQQGNLEYDRQQDGGVCFEGQGVDCSFWNGRNDQMAGARRMQTIQDMFDTKFPFYPSSASLGDSPPCDAQ